MFIEIKPYEQETLAIRFKAGREDFSKILQAIKKSTEQSLGSGAVHLDYPR
nr:hypothetical protein [Treponema sp. Marseille-Q3903]